ncbi:hypothetical protein N0V90_012848 [Kalmusia sp. IMI 367209]|nr:hypothetical protein N0V90_012848 [Kalmusia sp. IMI 367209]
MTGAKRDNVTWLGTDHKDKILLQFIKVQVEDSVPRRGLVDPAALHERWDARMTMLHNGDRLVIQTPCDEPVVDNMNVFSWFMTIITSAMMAALSKGSMEDVLYSFLPALFTENVAALEFFLKAEFPQHIDGWISAATVRNMASRARTVWSNLLAQKLVLPGDILEGDLQELVRLLVWLAGGDNQEHCGLFETDSSDVFAFAVVLKSLGLDAIDTVRDDEQEEFYSMESELIVRYIPDAIEAGFTDAIETGFTDAVATDSTDAIATRSIDAIVTGSIDAIVTDSTDAISTGFTDAISTGFTTDEDAPSLLHRQPKRHGMRIPLLYMEECVSIWPGTDADESNKLRLLFKDGRAASETLSITANPYSSTENGPRTSFTLSDETHRNVSSADHVVPQFVSGCFPIPTPTLIEAVHGIVKQDPSFHDREIESLEQNPESLAKMQAFVLGYYYGMLGRFVDDSKMSVPEAYGSWTWLDTKLLTRIRTILSAHSRAVATPSGGWLRTILSDHSSATATQSGGKVFEQQGILKLLGLLFVGAEEDQIRAVNPSTIGIHGRISVVTNTLLGSINVEHPAMRFCLLDTDPTAIPSNRLGIIGGGVQVSDTRKPLMLSDDCLQAIDDIVHEGVGEDFTSHIESDWDHNARQCHVVFRYKERLVGRMAPSTLELATKITIKERPRISSQEHAQSPARFYVAKPEHLISSSGYSVANCPQPDFGSADFNPNQPPICILTRNRPKARMFLSAHYCMTGYHRVDLVDAWPELGWDPARIDQHGSDMPIFLYSDSGDVADEELGIGRFIILA